MRTVLWATCLLFFLSAPVKAQDKACEAVDKKCLFAYLADATSAIEEKSWKDQIYRETAKLLARTKDTKAAITLIDKIDNADTKAMTIRGIGMEAAQTDMNEKALTILFEELRTKADSIQHPPSHAIALTYIAMAQAFAGDDDGAMATARDMDNDALRNKAYAESAEIQAERGDLDAALKSISQIEDTAFRNKAHRLISKIFAGRRNYEQALESARHIENAYQRAQAVLYILAKQISPEEVSLVE